MDDINQLTSALETAQGSRLLKEETSSAGSHQKPSEPVFGARPIPKVSAQPGPESSLTGMPAPISLPPHVHPIASPSGNLDSPTFSPSSPVCLLGRARASVQSSEPFSFGSTISLGNGSSNKGHNTAVDGGFRLPIFESLQKEESLASPISHFAFPSPGQMSVSRQSPEDPVLECQVALDAALQEIERYTVEGIQPNGDVAHRALGRARARLNGVPIADSGRHAMSISSSAARRYFSNARAQEPPPSRRLLFPEHQEKGRSLFDEADGNGDSQRQETASLRKLREFLALRSR
jgi:hypothetical protein